MIAGVRRIAGSSLQRVLPVRVYAGLRPITSELSGERLYAYLDALWQRRDLDGAVVEVGCFRGGTTRVACELLKRSGHPKPYFCVDTFEGFVPEQFQQDLRHGTSAALGGSFRINSPSFFAQLMEHYGCSVHVVAGDVATVADEKLPNAISVSLLDVDLEVPVYEGLRRLFPRLVDGGAILVDDCEPDRGFPGARAGYRRFVTEAGLPEEYFMGMGLVRKRT